MINKSKSGTVINVNFMITVIFENMLNFNSIFNGADERMDFIILFMLDIIIFQKLFIFPKNSQLCFSCYLSITITILKSYKKRDEIFIRFCNEKSQLK